MRVLVTGGAGFIGSHIVDALLADGHEVAVLDDLSTGHRHNIAERATLFEGDIVDSERVAHVFETWSPDAVSHQAAQTSVAVSVREPIADARVNVIGTATVLQACVQHRVERFVFASTGGAIYGEVPEGQRATIEWPPRPESPYACSKFAGEAYVELYRRVHGLRTTILRYANVYGPRQDPHGEAGVVAIFSRRLLDGQPLRINAKRQAGDDGCVRDYVSVGDVVRANRAALEGRLSSACVNVATGVGTTTRQVAEFLADALDLSGDRARLEPGAPRAGDLERSVLAPSPELLELGELEPTREGLRHTAHWFRDNR